MKLAVHVAVIGLLASTAVAQQAPATPQTQPSYRDEGAVIEQSKTLFVFDADGTGRREVYVKIRVESEAGVQQWGQVVAGYNAANETLELPLVRVTKHDRTIVDTPATNVQDLTSQVQRIAPVYTDFREKHVAVESFRPGDTLEVRMVTTVRTPYAPGQFWGDYDFNDSGIVLDEQLDLDVPAARQLIVRSRKGLDPVVTETQGRRRYHWASSHKVREDPDKKKESAEAAEPQPPAVRFTSFADWRQVGEWFGSLETAARVVTPEIRAKAQQLTAGKATDLAKLEALYNYVSTNFRYVSLSLGAGRYQPRAAADVLSTQYGDCKDKHTLLAALIDAAGLHASAVLINPLLKLDPDFPSPSQFNHVITRAVANGEPVWLDTTEEIAPFRMLPSVLRDKQALLISGASSRLERTPATNAEPSYVAVDFSGKLDESGALTGHVQSSFRGDAELMLRSAFRAVPSAQWKEMVEGLAKAWGLKGDFSNWHVSDPVAMKDPLAVNFDVRNPSFVTWGPTHLDLDLPLSRFISTGDLPDEDSKVPLKLREISTVSATLRLEFPAGATPSIPMAVNIERDYARYTSTAALDGRTLVFKRVAENRATELPADRRSDYVAYMRVLTSDIKRPLSVTSSVEAAAGSSTEADVKQLNSSGYQALQALDYPKAAALLGRAVDLDPKNRYAWNNLGNAYFGLRRTDDAIAAYKKQIEINPFDEYAYNNLGRAYWRKKQYADAERAFLKQIEINPLDKYAHDNLGQMYLEEKKYESAVTELEKALSVTPESASVEVQLGRAYLNANRRDAASEVFAKAIALSPTPATWNSVAYELSLHGMDLDRALQYEESALAVATATARNLELEHLDGRGLGTISAIAAYWDTLGWIYFKKGDTSRAEKYVSASWSLEQDAEVGDHLGQIFERQGRREDAVRLYAEAVSAENPFPDARAHLTALVGEAHVDETVSKHASGLISARTVKLPSNKAVAGKRAEFFVLIGQPGRVEAVTFIEGDEQLRPMTSALQLMPVVNVFPDDQPARIVRRGVAACSADGTCTFTMLLPTDAKPAK